MFAARRLVKKGFTLVEILIVVIILGILAAIVIPQFTSASDDARKNSLTSQVQTLRSQIELYKLQHTSTGAELFQGATDVLQWEELTSKTDIAGAVSATGKFGPYLQTLPVNNMNGLSKVITNTTTSEATTAVVDVTGGFVYNTDTGKFFALAKDGKVYLGG
jgi:general secretion pathway protein G